MKLDISSFELSVGIHFLHPILIIMGQQASVERTELPRAMRAAAYAKHGGSDVLYIDEGWPTPKLKAGEVMVKVHATCVNPVDVKFRAYFVPNFVVPLPKIPGSDFCGEIVDLDSSVRGFAKGDRVFGMMPLTFYAAGAAAEYVAVSAGLIAKASKNVIHFSDYAALPLVALTVLQATKAFEAHHRGNTAGKRVFIQAASGGVGSLAVQYCKNVLNMEVFGTCSSKNADFVRACGADHIIDYHTMKFTDVVHLADLVIDPKSYLYQDDTLNSDVLKKVTNIIYNRYSPCINSFLFIGWILRKHCFLREQA